MQSQRKLAALLFPAQPLSMLGFFQGLQQQWVEIIFIQLLSKGIKAKNPG